MGKRIFSNSNGGYETVVTIEPTFEIDFHMPDLDYSYPAAIVTVEFKHNGKPTYSTTFKKILVKTLYYDPYNEEGLISGVVQDADEMINGDLSEVGLGGLSTLDIYEALSAMGVSTNLDAGIMQKILRDSLNIPCCDDNDTREKDCFYDLEVLVYKIR